MSLSRRSRAFRSGDLAEGLGGELLRSFALIAPVPRPEDVGIDAYATLLRPEGDMLRPGGSFLVQFKTAKEKRVPRTGVLEMGWLRGLRKPFWIVSVGREEGRAEVYSTIDGVRHPNAPGVEAVVFRLGAGKPGFVRDGYMECRLTKPIFTFEIREAGRTDFGLRAYEHLEPILRHETSNLGLLLDLNRFEYGKGGQITLHDPARLKEELEAARPVVEHLLTLCAMKEDRLPVAAALMVVADFMSKEGVQIASLPVHLALMKRLLASSRR